MDTFGTYRNIEEYYNAIHNSNELKLSNPATSNRANNYTKVGFLHIGKCGGTEVLRHLKPDVKEIHWEENPSRWQNYDTKWIIWVRNPFARFVSAFNRYNDILKEGAKCKVLFSGVAYLGIKRALRTLTAVGIDAQ